MTKYNSDTIAAISTPPGKGGVAVIRLSGDEAVAIASKCIALRSKKALADCPSRTALYADFLDAGRPIDDVLITLFRAPHSYTGEDTVEISCHGGILLTRTLLACLLDAGARMATAGEFTRRAVFSGRLSLTEAEAIGSALEAKSVAQLHLAASPARGRLAKAISALHDDLLSLLGTLYAKIDYPEEDLADLSDAEINERLSSLLAAIDRLLATYRTGHAVNEGIPTVICGTPNVGKSSLYNLLSGEDLAIVTDIAGTTRDVLSSTVTVGSVLLHLFDTAGLHETADPIEEIGVARSRDKMESAELLLAMFDGTRPLGEEDVTLLRELQKSDKPVVALLNKCDEEAKVQPSDLHAYLENVIPFSAKTGEGKEALSSLLASLFTDERILYSEEAILSTTRQYASLTNARREIAASLAAFLAGFPADVASSDLEGALGELSDLDGRTVNEQVVGEIFSHFCVGK